MGKHLITFVGRPGGTSTTFHRCGATFGRSGLRADGRPFEDGDFTSAQWDTLREEPYLKVSAAPPPPGEDDADDGPDSTATPIPGDADEVYDAFRAAVGGLAPEAFGSNGSPRLDALRTAMPGRMLTAEQRDHYWTELTRTGFAAPSS